MRDIATYANNADAWYLLDAQIITQTSDEKKSAKYIVF